MFLYAAGKYTARIFAESAMKRDRVHSGKCIELYTCSGMNLTVDTRWNLAKISVSGQREDTS